MFEILPSLRTLLIDHLATIQTLTADMSPGDTTVTVDNTSRFRTGDEIFIGSAVTGLAEWKGAAGVPFRVESIVDSFTLELNAATVAGHTVANAGYVQKAIGHQPLKRVFIGDLRRIPDFPTITIAPVSEDNDWWAIGATEHEHRVAIRIYAQTENFEGSEVLLGKYATATREILLDHIHPIVTGQTEFFPLTADLPSGGTVVSVSDTSSFEVNGTVFIRDAQPRPSSTENVIRSILSPTELELATPAEFTFLVSRQAEILKVERYLYDTRPSSINYGYVPGSGGSLLRAAEIGWFGKEVICRPGNILT